ncbi:ABC transporter permease [Tistrella bauzanensis]
MAVGLALLIAPTGLIFRAVSGGGDALPPDLAVPGDRFGLSLIVGLVIKETPFLLALLLAAQARLGAGAVLARARCLGWRPASAWWRIVAPQIWPVLRWPVVAVLVYGIGTVDMAVVLGPSLPPSFAVRSLSLLFDADPARAAAGHAAALAQLALAAVAVGIWWLGERLARFWLAGGRGDHPARIDPPLVRRPRQPVAPALSGLSGLVGGLALLLAAASLATLVIWALAASWRFPDLLPMRWAPGRLADTVALLGCVIARTVWLGLLPVAIALPLAVLVLEREALGADGGTGAGRSLSQAAEALVYLPLLLPPAAFLAGIRALALRLGLDGTVVAVVWCHLLYVFPYLFLALREVIAAPTPAAAAGAQPGPGPGGAWVAVMLPLTARPMAIAAAIGFAVGVAQYLPALMIGGGRLPVLATEAVAAASGIDRRAASTAALLMTALPAIGFLLASLIRAPARAVRQ